MATTLTGATPTSGSGAYGAVPAVADPTSTALQAILGNLGNMGSIYNLSQGMGAASGAGAMANASQGLPGLAGYLSSAGGAVSDQIAGKIPQQDMAQFQQRAAEFGVGGGASNATLLRALGLTSMGQTQAGLNNLGGLISETPKGPAYDPSTMQVTPAAQQSAQQFANTMAAAPNPTAAAAANLAAQLAGLRSGGGSAGGGTRSMDPGQAGMQNMLNNPRDMSWFYNPSGQGTSTTNPNRTPPSEEDTSLNNWLDFFGYDSSGNQLFDDGSSGGTSGTLTDPSMLGDDALLQQILGGGDTSGYDDGGE